jgi:D-alanyl-D-alanine carboxypeptidase
MRKNLQLHLQQAGLVLFCSMGLLSASYVNATPPTLYMDTIGKLSIPNAVEHKPNGASVVYSGDMTYVPGTDGYKLTYLEAQPNFSNKTVVDEGFDPEIAKKLDALIDKIVTSYNKPGAIIRVERAGKVYRAVRGLGRIETKQPMRFNDRWKIASNTKPFVAQVALQLVQEGKIKLDDFVAPLLPDLMANMPNKDKITLRHLLQHTNGIPNYVAVDAIQCSMLHTPFRYWSVEEMLAIAADLAKKYPSTVEPGAEYHYSNSGILLLGALVEKLSSMKLGDAIYQRLLNPLRLYSTEYAYDPSISFDYAHGYTDYPPCIDGGTKLPPSIVKSDGTSENVKGDGVLENATFLDPSPAGAAGAILSNAEDMGKWTRYYAEGKALDPTLFKEQNTFKTGYTLPNDFGFSVDMGLSVMRINDRYLGHPGQINGYENMGVYDPQTDTTMLLMMNHYDLLESFEQEVSAVMIFDIIPIIDGTAGTTRADENKRAFMASGCSMRSILENACR